MSKHLRDSNLDLLRSIAILSVVIYHFAILWPIENESIRMWTSLGNYGVDLFFVLSGFLIGGLYFTEHKANGHVGGLRFWVRRALRTMPPYFMILPIAWLAVYLTRREPFAWQYLVFLQNYMVEMPFYLASWSLCVEEHFYFFLVPILGISFKWRLPILPSLIGLIVTPVFLRVLDSASAPAMPFGYSETATHLRISGILLGVLAAYILHYHHSVWAKLKGAARWLSIPSLLTFLTLPFWSLHAIHYFAVETAAITSFMVLCAIQGEKPNRIANSKFTFWIANTSYSIYLTHGLAFQVGVLIGKKHFLPQLVLLPLWLVLAVVSGFSFWFFVERNAIRVRDKLVPKFGADQCSRLPA